MTGITDTDTEAIGGGTADRSLEHPRARKETEGEKGDGYLKNQQEEIRGEREREKR
jgi:hypothetical protein